MPVSFVGAATAAVIAMVACRGDESAPGAANDPGPTPPIVDDEDGPVDAAMAWDATAEAEAEDAGVIAEHVPYEPPRALPPGECAPSVGEWNGTTYRSQRMVSARYFILTTNVTWRMASTEGCVDRYVPIGTVTIDHEIFCCRVAADDRSRLLDADDGVMIARGSTPPTVG